MNLRYVSFWSFVCVSFADCLFNARKLQKNAIATQQNLAVDMTLKTYKSIRENYILGLMAA